jgi:CBS domain containing-hemolysin-like protein
MELLAILLSLVLIAFFSGVEIAFLSANKLRVELLKEKGSSRAKIISAFNNNPSRFISTMLVGINISLVLFGSITASYFTKQNFPFLPEGEVPLLLLQTLFTTFIILVFGELFPKLLFRVNSDQSLITFAYPIRFFYIILSPVNMVFHTLARWLIKLVIGSEPTEGKQTFTKEDLEYLVKETAVSDEDEKHEADHLNSEIFEKALYLKDVKVRSCMVPRPEIQAIDVTESVARLKARFVETKLSRILVYEENIDHVLGYVHHLDLLKNPSEIRPLIRSIQAIPGSMTARDLLLQFIRERKNIAWVVDEYGGTAGIITLEDLIEEIFGEIEDEHDTPELTEKKVADDEFIFSGRLEVDYLNRKYDLNIPEDDYTTLSGYLISGFEDIPEAGTTFDLDNFHIKILRATDTRIELVSLKLKKKE